jgi:hypothetical protein
MPAKKRPVRHEPLLTTVARKLGHAAGTLTKVTQEITENLSTLPKSAAMKPHQAAKSGASEKHSPVRARPRPHNRRPRKKTRRGAQERAAQSPATVKKRKTIQTKG